MVTMVLPSLHAVEVWLLRLGFKLSDGIWTKAAGAASDDTGDAVTVYPILDSREAIIGFQVEIKLSH